MPSLRRQRSDLEYEESAPLSSYLSNRPAALAAGRYAAVGSFFLSYPSKTGSGRCDCMDERRAVKNIPFPLSFPSVAFLARREDLRTGATIFFPLLFLGFREAI